MKLLRLFVGLLLVCGLSGIGVANAATTNNTTTTQAITKPINLNTADAQTLEQLKGIGEKKAQAIVDYRDQNGKFASIDDLTKVRGISTKFIANLQKNNPNMIVVR